jgi:hypothetical protein
VMKQPWIRTGVRAIARASILLLLLSPIFSAEAQRGSICIAPLPKGAPITAATPELACPSGQFSLKIDNRQTVSWSSKDSIKIDDLDLGTQHRVAVSCNGKPHQSFRFRFSEFKSRDLCLFLNDLYQTAQLWENERVALVQVQVIQPY